MFPILALNTDLVVVDGSSFYWRHRWQVQQVQQASAANDAGSGAGGGGGWHNGSSGALRTGSSGGSGVVILRMLTSKYTGTTSGSPTVST